MADVQDDIDDLMRRKVGRSGSVPVVVMGGAGAGTGVVATFDKYVLIPDDFRDIYGFDDAYRSCLDEKGRAWGRGATGTYPGPCTEVLFREKLDTKTFEKVLEIETDYVSPPGEIRQLCCTQLGVLWGLGRYYAGGYKYAVCNLGMSDDPEWTEIIEHTLAPSASIGGLVIDSQDRHWIAERVDRDYPYSDTYAFFCLDGDITLEVPYLDYLLAAGITNRDWLIGPDDYGVFFAKENQNHRVGNFGTWMSRGANSYGRFCLDPSDLKTKVISLNTYLCQYFPDPATCAYMIYEIHDAMLP